MREKNVSKNAKFPPDRLVCSLVSRLRRKREPLSSLRAIHPVVLCRSRRGMEVMFLYVRTLLRKQPKEGEFRAHAVPRARWSRRRRMGNGKAAAPKAHPTCRNWTGTAKMQSESQEERICIYFVVLGFGCLLSFG
jgi:hypothetical protein